MKLNKIVMVSIALFALCGTVAFADNQVVDSETGDSDTYAGSVGDTGIPSASSIQATLASDEGNSGDQVKLLTDIANTPLVTSLYYNNISVTDSAALYDADWDLSQTFSTNTFTVGVKGSTTEAVSLNVTVAATPFALVSSIDTNGNATVTAGEMTVAVDSLGTPEDSSTASSTVYAIPTSYTIQSEQLVAGSFYDPEATTFTNGIATGKVVSFTLTSTGKSSLPAGRYQSVVTLTYALD